MRQGVVGIDRDVVHAHRILLRHRRRVRQAHRIAVIEHLAFRGRCLGGRGCGGRIVRGAARHPADGECGECDADGERQGLDTGHRISFDGAHGGGAQQFVTQCIDPCEVGALPFIECFQQRPEVDFADLVAGQRGLPGGVGLRQQRVLDQRAALACAGPLRPGGGAAFLDGPQRGISAGQRRVFEQARLALAFAAGALLERDLDLEHQLGAFDAVAVLHRTHAHGDVGKAVATLQYHVRARGLGAGLLRAHRGVRICVIQCLGERGAVDDEARRLIGSRQRCIGTASQHRVQGGGRLLLGREAFDPLAL